jgi:hypothetical protein
MKVAYPLAHYDKATITAAKSFIEQAPGEPGWFFFYLKVEKYF